MAQSLDGAAEVSDGGLGDAESGDAVTRDAELADVDLSFLSDRARAYVMGLEAKLREIRLDNERLREEMVSGATERARKMSAQHYKQGWKDCANNFMATTSKAISALRAARGEAFDASRAPYAVGEVAGFNPPREDLA